MDQDRENRAPISRRPGAQAALLGVIGCVFSTWACSGSDGARSAGSGGGASGAQGTTPAGAAAGTVTTNGGSGASSGASSAAGGGSGALSASGGSTDAGSGSTGSANAGSANAGGGAGGGCTTRIGYGDLWNVAPNHTTFSDSVSSEVSWDGACQSAGNGSSASLSNGFQPSFSGASACVLSLDDSCTRMPCTTRVSYGASWIAAPNHPATEDTVVGHVFWDRECANDATTSRATLSNGWTPTFMGQNACQLSFEYANCGGLYQNPVFDGSCPDPGVLYDGNEYVTVCTSGNSTNAFPIRTSPDLVHWTSRGSMFPSAQKPTWATSDFWAPEIHRVGDHFVAYFSARQQSGKLAIGAANAASALGPFTDRGKPLIADDPVGLIDATEADDTDGTHYVIWKVDGNANGSATPIDAQPLSADGMTITGTKTELISNDQKWEGPVVEGPFVLHHGGYFYLFYSGNSYANASYAVGVARAKSLLGPYDKLPDPIVSSNAAWIGPGHCSVLDLADGTTYMVYHAWKAGHVNGSGDARVLLVDQVFWGDDGWPRVPQAPSVHSRPMP